MKTQKHKADLKYCLPVQKFDVLQIYTTHLSIFKILQCKQSLFLSVKERDVITLHKVDSFDPPMGVNNIDD